MIRWKPIGQTKNCDKQLQEIKQVVLIGIRILAILLLLFLLNGCTKTEIRYVEMDKEFINCIETINTPEDMLECLNEYSVKY